MDSIDSLSKILEYAEKHNVPVGAVLFALLIFVLAWLGKKGGGKALNVVGGMLDAADKMLESMQRRLDATTLALEQSERRNELLLQKIRIIEAERDQLQAEVTRLMRARSQI